MRIQNNIMAMNTHRFYTANNNAVSKSAEKLSSGYRVNRAGDDAAGLAISEKMRSEIRGLTMASKNSQDGVSMVQTAEGALTEVHSMLQRMKELAVQAASDSNENEIDRPALDAEFQQLVKEIDDIAMTTTFNDMKLLDGSFTGKVIQVGSRTGNEMDISIGNMDAESLGLIDQTEAPTVAGVAAGAAANGDGTDAASIKFTLTEANFKVTGNGTYNILGADDANGDPEVLASVNVREGMSFEDFQAALASVTFSIEDSGTDNIGKVNFAGEIDNDGNVVFTADTVEDLVDDGGVLNALTGDEAAYTDANLKTQNDASITIDRCRDSINQVSTERAKLGAIQNRLEHKISNLDNTVENVSAAEARIRDVDIAKEMTNFTKNQILSQAATAMLAQANSLPQNVLSLLQ